MSDENEPRDWREVARELANQTDHKKIAELSKELNQAIAGHKGPTAILP